MNRTMKQIQMGKSVTKAEWDSETVTEERLTEIKKIFDAWLIVGVAFNVTVTDQEAGADGSLMKEFDKEKDILLFPRLQGGARG